MRSQTRAARGGRANKITKPKSRTQQAGRVSQEALDQLSLAASTTAEQQLNNEQQQHHHNPFHAQADSPELDDAVHEDGSATHLHPHQHHPSPDDPHVGQLAAAAAAHGVFVPNGPGGGGTDPSIHPALQGFGHMAHAQFASALDQHQATMEAQMQETAAAAAAASDVRTAEHVVRDSGYDKVDFEQAASALSKRLMVQPGRRLAKQRRAEQQLNLVRRSNVEALLAHVSGQQAASACKNCHKGHGPWTECVVVDGQMCGSCANCWYNASGARCSFHETNNPQAHQPAILPANATASAGFGLPILAPAGGVQQIPHAITQSSQMTYPLDGETKNMIEQAWAEAPNLSTKDAQLRLKVQVAMQQLALAVAELNEHQARNRGPMAASGQNLTPGQPGGGGGGSQVPDAAMDEAHGDDVGT